MFDKFDIGIYSMYLYMKCPVFSGWVGAPSSYGTSLLQSPTQFVFTIVIARCIQNHEIVNSVTFLAFSKVYDALLRNYY